MLLDAETGVGKTVAVLSAALGKKEPGDRIVIFTKMLGQMNAWFRELGLINDYSRRFGGEEYAMIPLLGKSHTCPQVTNETKKQFAQLGCSLFGCNHMRAFSIMAKNERGFNQYSETIIDHIKKEIREGVNYSDIVYYLDTKVRNSPCTYLSLKSALRNAEIIVTTYPFLLHSSLRSNLVETANLELEKTILIVDEAHNLAKGAIRSLSYRTVNRAAKEIGTHPVFDYLRELQEKPGLHPINISEQALEDLQILGKNYLLDQFERGSRDISYTLSLCEFLSDAVNCYLTADRKYTLYHRDPRRVLNPVKTCKKLILLSGTFQPLNYFADFLGVRNAEKISVASAKVKQNRIVLTTTDPELTMKYKARSKELYLKFGRTIRELAQVVPGHTLVFTPNYDLTMVLANLLDTKFFERPEQDVNKLVYEVTHSKTKSIIIAPARGKISEGIEFVKNDCSVIAAVIVAGLPFPPPSKAFKEIIKAYSKIWGEQKAYTYMNFLQATVTMRQCLGRMIRSERDRGAWMILDNRIGYMNLFPRAIQCKNTKQMIERLRFFFQRSTTM